MKVYYKALLLAVIIPDEQTLALTKEQNSTNRRIQILPNGVSDARAGLVDRRWRCEGSGNCLPHAGASIALALDRRWR